MAKAKKQIVKMTAQQLHAMRYSTGDEAPTIAELLENLDLTCALRTQQYLCVERIADLIGRNVTGVRQQLGKMQIGRLLSEDGKRIVLSDFPAFEPKISENPKKSESVERASGRRALSGS